MIWLSVKFRLFPRSVNQEDRIYLCVSVLTKTEVFLQMPFPQSHTHVSKMQAVDLPHAAYMDL